MIVLFQRIQNFVDFFVRQIFVIIEINLHHRRSSAASQTFDARYGKKSVAGRFADVNAEFVADMFGDFRLAHNSARQGFANLYVIFSDGTQIEHRIKRRRFPNVRDFQIEKFRQKIYAAVVDVTALALNDEKQRNQRRTFSFRRIFRQMRFHFFDDRRRKLRDFVGVKKLICKIRCNC